MDALVQHVPLIIRQGSRQTVKIEVVDCNGQPADAVMLTLEVHGGGCRTYQEDFNEVLYPPHGHRIRKVPGVPGIYTIDWGDSCVKASCISVGATFPTGFVGGERFTFFVDDAPVTVIFDAADQSLAQVVFQINSQVGPIVGHQVAFANAGRLELRSVRKGRRGMIIPQADPAVLAILGLTAFPVYGTDITNESSCTDKLTFIWRAATADNPDVPAEILQTVYVMPIGLLGMIGQLRLLIDKAVKLVREPEACFLGYTDAQLVQYLIQAIQLINQYQPSIFFHPDNFPYAGFGNILIEAALVCGVTSQTLFAIDTDVTSYNDQGQSFVINHQQPLAAYLNSLTQKLDKAIPMFKLHFVRSGSVLTQAGGSMRFNMLLDAAPSGALFRGVMFKALAGLACWAWGA